MSFPVRGESVREIQVQYQQPVETPTTPVADKLPTTENTAAQQKTKLESFKSSVSGLLERSRGNLAIGAGASLIGLSGLSAIMLAPITIPGAFVGVTVGVAAAKSDSVKAAFGGKGNLVKTGLTIGSCLTYGLGLLGAKLIEYGVSKNRLDKYNKPAQANEKVAAQPKSESSETSSEISNEKSIASSEPLPKPTLKQLEKRLEEVKGNYHEATAPEFANSLGDKLRTATNAKKQFNVQIEAQEESISYCKELNSNILDRYEGPDYAKFNDILGKYILTPSNKREAFLEKFNDADVMMTDKGYVTMDQIRRDLKNFAQNMKDIDEGNKLINDSFIKNKMELKSEIKDLTNELNVLKLAYDNEVSSLESQIKSLIESSAKPKLTDEEVLAKQMQDARNHHIH